jgi:putative hydrolase of HD superfamily
VVTSTNNASSNAAVVFNLSPGAMPVLLNLNNEGGNWKEHSISFVRVVERVGLEIEAGCPALWRYLESRLVEASEKKRFGEEAPNGQERS